MKTILHTIVFIIVWLGISLAATGNQLFAAEVPPSKPLLEKPSPDDSKKETPAGKTKNPTQQEQIAKLIEQLGDNDYYIRQNAQNELARLGFEAFDALNAATNNDDLEIASRAKYLLRLMRIEWTAKNEPPEVKKLLKDYELQPDDSRLDRMQALAAMPDGNGLLALCRLVRFEKSEVLSKLAVIKLLHSPSGAEPPKGARADAIRKLLEKSSRTSASWILAWLRLADDAQSITQWNKIIDAETTQLRLSPGETSREIVTGLVRYQIARMKKQGQTQEIIASMRRLVDLENGDLESLSELLDWLMEQKAWKMIDELATRFNDRFEREPSLLYVLAQAQKEQGDAAKADETAQRAFRLNTGSDEIKLIHRYLIAQRLIQQGSFPWAKQELKYIIERGGTNNATGINAHWILSEMLHDQGDDMAAADVLEMMLKSTDAKTNTAIANRIATALERLYFYKKRPDNSKLIDRTLSEIRARMFFLQACHWDRKDDQAKRRECLEKALALEPGDVDVLIACHRLPEQSPEYRQKIKALLRQTADDLRTEITAEPDNPSLYNQFAWLVGNTEGNFDEALKCAKKSLQLSPDNGGFYDTLARVYYAKGDYENAMKNQQKAAELEPHSGQIAKQLELFRKAQEEHKK